MNPKQYVEASLKTESKPSQINFGTIATDNLLGVMVCTGDLVDAAKKVMFYGKEPDLARIREAAENLSKISAWFLETVNDYPLELTNRDDFKSYEVLAEHLQGIDLDNINLRLMHASMGLFTEAGETAGAIVDAWRGRVQPDRVNFCEELGDGFWYAAIAADELGVSFETLFDQNVTKLQDKRNGRYKQGSFDVDAANFRNLEAERSLLESGVTKANVEPEVLDGDVEPMLATTDINVFYMPKTQDFAWFDESGSERGREPSFELAMKAMREYMASLNRPKREAPVLTETHAPAQRFAPDQSQVAAHAPQTLGEKARALAVGALDKIDQGVEAAKAQLKK